MENRNHARLVSSMPVLLYVDGHGRVKGTILDVSQNVALTELRCEYNKLTAIDVSNNTSLIKLYCGANEIAALDISCG